MNVQKIIILNKTDYIDHIIYNMTLLIIICKFQFYLLI